jgi:hypothetical protein
VVWCHWRPSLLQTMFKDPFVDNNAQFNKNM